MRNGPSARLCKIVHGGSWIMYLSLACQACVEGLFQSFTCLAVIMTSQIHIDRSACTLTACIMPFICKCKCHVPTSHLQDSLLPCLLRAFRPYIVQYAPYRRASFWIVIPPNPHLQQIAVPTIPGAENRDNQPQKERKEAKKKQC